MAFFKTREQTPEQRIDQKATQVEYQMRDEIERIKRELRGNRPVQSHSDIMRKLESEWRKEEMERNHNVGMLRTLRSFQDLRSAGKNVDRKRLNAFMKTYGYKWVPDYFGTEEDHIPSGDFGILENVTWELRAPDNRVVTIGKALSEIEALISEKI